MPIQPYESFFLTLPVLISICSVHLLIRRDYHHLLDLPYHTDLQNLFHLVPMKPFFICYIYMPKNLYPQLPSAPSKSQESFNIKMVRKYYQDIANLKTKYSEKQRKYKNAYNKLLHVSTSASSVGVISGVSTIETAFTVVGLPISASLGVVSTISPCVGGILLLTSKKYKKKLLKCYELLDKITSSLATFEVLISLSMDDGTVIDAKEFHKLQTLYLQLMTYIRNIDRKMKVETEENFQKTIMDEIKNF